MSALLKVLLVWLIITFRVSDLRRDKVLFVEDVIANTGQICVSREQFQYSLQKKTEREGGRVQRKAYWRSVSKLTLTTPCEMPAVNSSLLLPDPPWKTRKRGLSSLQLIFSLA